MSDKFFKVKNGLKISPVDPSNVTNEEAGDLIIDSTDQNRLKVWNTTKSAWDKVGSGGGATPALWDKLVKADSNTVVFTKTGAGTLEMKADTSVYVKGQLLDFSVAETVVMPTLTIGTDYAIYACQDGTVRADDNFSAPSGYTTANSTLIGGFHYGLVSATETVAGGSFATTGNGMIWTQTDVDAIKGINQFSMWDLNFRPRCQDPRGMALIANNFWMDIYYCGTNHTVNGTSRAGTDVVSGTVLAKKPLEFGGNGTSTYSDGSWYTFNEVARAYGKRLPKHSEFIVAAFGTTENQSLGGASVTIPTTLRQAGYTSKYGLEQVTGHIWIWTDDSSYRQDGAYTPWNSRNVNGGRGQVYLYSDVGLVYAIVGGYRGFAAFSGSRASHWHSPPWDSAWHIGLRAACDHLVLV